MLKGITSYFQPRAPEFSATLHRQQNVKKKKKSHTKPVYNFQNLFSLESNQKACNKECSAIYSSVRVTQKNLQESSVINLIWGKDHGLEFYLFSSLSG